MGRRTEEYRRAVEVWGSQRAAARALGIPRSTIQSSLSRAELADRIAELLPAGTADAIAKAGSDALTARVVWRRVKDDETGGWNTVMSAVPPPPPEDVAAAIRAALEDLPAVAAAPPPQQPAGELLTLIPIADAHIGLMAWAPEAGRDWNTRSGAQRLVEWGRRVVARTPASSCCILLAVGDLLHVDNSASEGGSGRIRHDTDTRHANTIATTIASLAALADAALRLHARVILRVLPGNHDPHASQTVAFALQQRYRGEPRVQVRAQPSEFFVHQFGAVLIAAHHGHRAKWQRIVNCLADEHAPLWGRTRHRYLFTGHLHSERSARVGGVICEQLPALCARDAWTAANAFGGHAALSGITFCRERGEVSRVTVRA